MNRYAQLSNNVIANVIESDTDPDGVNGEWIECGNAGPGWVYDGEVFTAPLPVDDHTAWLIDIGPFYDRFGPAKMAVLTSPDAGVKAILSDVSIRKWLDLKRPDVASSLAYIGSKVPAVDATLQATILTTPVAHEENVALRKLYF